MSIGDYLPAAQQKIENQRASTDAYFAPYRRLLEEFRPTGKRLFEEALEHGLKPRLVEPGSYRYFHLWRDYYFDDTEDVYLFEDGTVGRSDYYSRPAHDLVEEVNRLRRARGGLCDKNGRLAVIEMDKNDHKPRHWWYAEEFIAKRLAHFVAVGVNP